jgi:hypothetical protein
MDESKKSFEYYLNNRKKNEKNKFFTMLVIQKAYFTGAYAKAVILSSWNSEVSRKNTTFKTWLSNQIISYRNLDRIFEMSFRFEQKLKLKLRNDSEVRKLAHGVPISGSAGISNSKISFAFVAGFDDYAQFLKENPSDKDDSTNKEKQTK